MKCNKVNTASFLLLFLCATSSLVFTQESDVDNLFSDSQDIVTQENANNSSDLTTAFTNAPKLQFSGSFSATGGLGIGYTQWPDFAEPLKYYDGSAGATATTTLIMKAQPSSNLSIYGDISTTLDTTSSPPTYSWSDFKIGSLYFDYYGIPNISIRGGQYATTWGHGRIFSAANLMSDSSSSVSLRLSLPLVLQGLSLFALVNNNYFTTAAPTVYEYAYAGIVDHIIGPLRLTGAVRYQKKEGVRTLFSLQGTILGVDVFADTVIRYVDTFQQPIFVGGFFKEYSNTRLYGEYQYDGTQLDELDHSIGLVLMQKRLLHQPLDGGVKWEHTFFDNSGQFIPGITWSGLPHFTLQVALPITYGPENSRYVTKNEDPGNRKILLAIAVKIEGKF